MRPHFTLCQYNCDTVQMTIDTARPKSLTGLMEKCISTRFFFQRISRLPSEDLDIQGCWSLFRFQVLETEIQQLIPKFPNGRLPSEINSSYSDVNRLVFRISFFCCCFRMQVRTSQTAGFQRPHIPRKSYIITPDLQVRLGV